MTSDASLARSLVDRFSVVTATGAQGAVRGDEEIVVVPFGEAAAVGFDRAHGLLAEGKRVRLIGHGVTIRSRWPSWTAATPHFTVAELTAYRPRDLGIATEAQRHTYSAWLDDVFGGLFPDIGGAAIFYGAACMRVFQVSLVAAPVGVAIAAQHPSATVHLTVDAPIGDPLDRALRETGGRLLRPSRGSRPEPPWALAVGALTAACWAATAVDRVREFRAARATQDALQHRRGADRARTAPALWVVVVADWERFNRHLLHALVLPALASGTPVGVLLGGTLAPGARGESAGGARVGAELWSGLAPLAAHLPEVIIDQVVGAERLSHLAADLLAASRRTAVAGLRVALRGSLVGAGVHLVDLRPRALDVAKLLTMDVARATAAYGATRRLRERRSFAGQTVVFATANGADAVVAEELLRSGGAQTMEHFHGSLGFGEVGAAESRCTRCVFTVADARVCASLHQRCVVAGMPARADEPRRTPRAMKRALLLTNYVHRDHRTAAGFPHEPLLSELLRSEEVIREVLGDDAEIRWRPHPAEDPATFERVGAAHPRIERTAGTSLDEDIAASDVVITSHSTAIYEALFAGVPLFVHIGPEHEGTPAAEYLDPARTFFYAEELRPGLAAAAAAIASGAADALAPEHAARRALFGPGGVPQPLLAALADLGSEVGAPSSPSS